MLRSVRLFVVVALLAAPALARGQARGASKPVVDASSTTSVAALTVERQKLRGELNRVNAEIDALKQDKRSLREDYRLRARMADAEALAQRLTDVDVRIERLTPGSARRGDATLAAAPVARPSDDRAALEAKADILADQARRLEQQAEGLAGRAGELRGRQELRRRAGQLERDPFSPLEQSKRRVASGATPRDLGNGVTSSPGFGSPMPARGSSEGVPTAMPGPTAGGTVPPGATGLTTDASKSTGSSTAGGSAPIAMPVGAAGGTDAPGSVAGQFRGILDAATLAEIRKLETAGSSMSSLQAMERALAALRARAAQLNASATALRARAKTTP